MRTYKEILSDKVDCFGRFCGKKLAAKSTFFTSDTHWFHIKILEYDARNLVFSDLDDMTTGLIARWNKKVPHDADVFILGDIALGGKSRANDLAAVLAELHGRKYLIPGNHDTYILESDACLKHLDVLLPQMEITVDDNGKKQGIVLSHYAMKVWNKSHHEFWSLNGHSHNSMPENYTIKALDVGINGPHCDYAPLSFYEIKTRMDLHESAVVDHHNAGTNDKF